MEKQNSYIISDFINERMICMILYKKCDPEILNKIIEEADLENIFLRMKRYLEDFQNFLPDVVYKNAINFVHDVRYNHKDKFYNVELFNSIIGICNSRKGFNESYMAVEYSKFVNQNNILKNIIVVFNVELDYVVQLEAELYDFIICNLYMENEDYYGKCGLYDEYLSSSKYLHMINYILNACPQLFMIEHFNDRIYLILEANKQFFHSKITKDNGVKKELRYYKKFNDKMLKKIEKR